MEDSTWWLAGGVALLAPLLVTTAALLWALSGHRRAAATLRRTPYVSIATARWEDPRQSLSAWARSRGGADETARPARVLVEETGAGTRAWLRAPMASRSEAGSSALRLPLRVSLREESGALSARLAVHWAFVAWPAVMFVTFSAVKAIQMAVTPAQGASSTASVLWIVMLALGLSYAATAARRGVASFARDALVEEGLLDVAGSVEAPGRTPATRRDEGPKAPSG